MDQSYTDAKKKKEYAYTSDQSHANQILAITHFFFKFYCLRVNLITIIHCRIIIKTFFILQLNRLRKEKYATNHKKEYRLLQYYIYFR